MPNIQEILKKIQHEMSCPICAAKFLIKDIKIRGAFNHSLIIETVCTEGHLTLFMTIFRRKEEKNLDRLDADEVLDFNNKLNNFNGDFEKLWKN